LNGEEGGKIHRGYANLLKFPGGLRGVGGFFRSLHFQGFRSLFLEAVYASFGIHQFLAAGEERVTC
jgi:hypothetical protein